MFDYFLILTCSLIPHEIYSFLAFYGCNFLYSSPPCRNTLSIFCRVGLVVMNYFRLDLSWKVFSYSTIFKANFAGYSNPDWQSSARAANTINHCIMAPVQFCFCFVCLRQRFLYLRLDLTSLCS